MHPIENHNLNVKFYVEHALKEMDMVMTTKRLQCLGISLVTYDPVNVDVEFTRICTFSQANHGCFTSLLVYPRVNIMNLSRYLTHIGSSKPDAMWSPSRV